MRITLLLSRALCATFTTALILVSAAAAENLTVVGFNVESGGADPKVIGAQIETLRGGDLWGFSEVENASWAAAFEHATAQAGHAKFQGILGATGGTDRLLIVYNSDRFDAVRHFELNEINLQGRYRAPLVAELKLKSTGQSLLFMVNHLCRTHAECRHEQARLLNQWAAAQTLPVIAVGDYNFDWNVRNGEMDHDRGYDLLTAHDAFSWIPPGTLIRTKCAVPRVLDFTFVAGAARSWQGSSDILFGQESYCPDDRTTSDHRPVRTTFRLDAGS